MPLISSIAFIDVLVRPATAGQWLDAWQTLGFTPAGQIRGNDTDGHTLRHQPSGAQLIISVARPGGTADTDLDTYGEGVRDVAFFTDDVPAAYAALTAAGGAPVFRSSWTFGGAQIAVAGGIGRLQHTLLADPATPPAPGWDHAAVILPAGELTGAARFYQRAGFTWTPAGTGRDGMISGAAVSGAAALTLTAARTHLETAAAVRHVALPTTGIGQMVDGITGVRWAVAPPGWAQTLTVRPDLGVLSGQGVPAGQDSGGRLLRQCFTGPLVPGCALYAELIQRRSRPGQPPAEGYGWDTADQILAARRSPV